MSERLCCKLCQEFGVDGPAYAHSVGIGCVCQDCLDLILDAVFALNEAGIVFQQRNPGESRNWENFNPWENPE